MILILYIAVAVLAFANFCTELRRDLMMLQQNSYRRDRYMRWLSQSGDTTSGWRLAGIIVTGICLTPFYPPTPGIVLLGIFAVLSMVSLMRRRYKKPLVMTPRALRIYITAIVLGALAAGGAMLIWSAPWTTSIRAAALTFGAAYCLSHVFIVLSNMILHPVEQSINRRYIREAKDMLAQMKDLRIIGITGSYGKTTTKHYLYRILSEQYETLMTPGSYNTPLGVVRTVREMLKPYHEVFIVEMGAKARGDIAEICDIVHPSRGIITAVGPQHLESFKSIANVQATKFELADALPADGLIVVNDDFPRIADRPVDNTRCLRYAVNNVTDSTDYTAENIDYSPSGTSFTVRCLRDGWMVNLHTPLVGECNISNVMAAVVMARDMGVDDKHIAYAVERLEQVEHRLSIKRVPGGLTIIDDAFNSNPVGSAMALDVLAAMKTGKRILVTPGMIELGDEQEHLNAEFGRKAASCADLVIVVGEYNREAIVSGLEEGGMPAEAIRKADSFAHAQQILTSLSAPGDIVLYENDLPDTFK